MASAPTVTITFLQPSSSTHAEFGVTSFVLVRGRVQWVPARPGYVQDIRLQILDASTSAVVTGGGFAQKSSSAPDAFSWSRSFKADTVVRDGILRAYALDSSGRSIATADIPIRITPPTVEVAINRPANDAHFGIDEAIEVGGYVRWNPPKSDYVESVRVLLIRKADQVVLDGGTAQRTPALNGKFHFIHSLLGQIPLVAGVVRTLALDRNGDELGRQEVDVVVKTPTDCKLSISSPARTPTSSFNVNTPIPVSGKVTWDTATPNFVRSVQLLLIRNADQLVADTSPTQLTPSGTGTLSWKGTLDTSEHILGATVRALAFDKNQDLVAQDEVAIEIP